MSIDGLMDQQDGAHPYSEVSFSLKEKGILTHAMAWMSLGVIVLSKTNGSQRDR